MTHQHGHEPVGPAHITTRTRVSLLAIIALVSVLTAVGLVLLWPDQQRLDALPDPLGASAPGVTFENATILSADASCEDDESTASSNDCMTATVLVETGPETGEEIVVQVLAPASRSGLRPGDGIQLIRIPAEEPGLPATLEYFGTNRLLPLALLAVLFVAAVLVIARLRGLLALFGLGFSGWVLFSFMLPALMSGRSGLAVALVGSTAIMFVVLYATHGVSMRTTAAFAGTLAGLLLTAGLGTLAVEAARLSGLHSEDSAALSTLVPGLDFRDLVLCALTVAGLGVLNDVTITQASAVWELHGAAPALSRRRVFARGMRIGRDHIASTIYTIVFAYAGASLALLMLLHFYDRPLLDLLSTEEFAAEIVQTLATATGLVLSVPITTGIAAMTISPLRDAEPERPASTPRRAA